MARCSSSCQFCLLILSRILLNDFSAIIEGSIFIPSINNSATTILKQVLEVIDRVGLIGSGMKRSNVCTLMYMPMQPVVNDL